MLNVGKTIALAFFSISIAQADLKEEVNQQLVLESKLLDELNMAKHSSTIAYQRAFSFLKDDSRNSPERLKILEDSNTAWNIFIDKTCLYDINESIGTRAENTQKTKCMTKKYNQKKDYYLKSM